MRLLRPLYPALCLVERAARPKCSQRPLPALEPGPLCPSRIKDRREDQSCPLWVPRTPDQDPPDARLPGNRRAGPLTRPGVALSPVLQLPQLGLELLRRIPPQLHQLPGPGVEEPQPRRVEGTGPGGPARAFWPRTPCPPGWGGRCGPYGPGSDGCGRSPAGTPRK